MVKKIWQKKHIKLEFYSNESAFVESATLEDKKTVNFSGYYKNKSQVNTTSQCVDEFQLKYCCGRWQCLFL